MSDGHSLEISSAQIVSSLLGYCGLGVAIACFLPLIFGNAAKRNNGTGGLFLVTWLAADAFNIAGIIKLKLPLSQLFLGIWYLIADAILGTELLLWGHPGRLAPKPTPAKTLIKKREMEHKHKWILNFDRTFEKFTLWDNTKVVVSCIFFGATWWGIYFVSMLYQSGGSFKVEVPTSHPTLALVLGVLATALFTAARFPEIIEGEVRHRKKEEPTIDLADGVFVFLVIENLFNLGSIFVLAFDPSLDKDGLRTKYLMGELPWILGGVIPIMTDAYLIVRIYQWQKAWAKTSYSNEPDKKAEISKVQIDIERTEAAMNELKVRKENIEVGIAAFDHHKKVQKENENRAKGKWTDVVRQRVDRPKKPKKSSLHKDWLANKSALDPQYPSESRKARQELDEKHGLERLKFSSDPEFSDSKSEPGMSPVDSSGDEAHLLQGRPRASNSRRESNASHYYSAVSVRRSSRSGRSAV